MPAYSVVSGPMLEVGKLDWNKLINEILDDSVLTSLVYEKIRLVDRRYFSQHVVTFVSSVLFAISKNFHDTGILERAGRIKEEMPKMLSSWDWYILQRQKVADVIYNPEELIGQSLAFYKALTNSAFDYLNGAIIRPAGKLYESILSSDILMAGANETIRFGRIIDVFEIIILWLCGILTQEDQFLAMVNEHCSKMNIESPVTANSNQ